MCSSAAQFRLKTLKTEASFGIIYPWRHDPLIHIEVHPNESIDAALKRFNMKLQQSGLLREVKEHAHYEKPSEKRRRARRRSSKSKF